MPADGLAPLYTTPGLALQMAWHRYKQQMDLLYLLITVPADGLAPLYTTPGLALQMAWHRYKQQMDLLYLLITVSADGRALLYKTPALALFAHQCACRWPSTIIHNTWTCSINTSSCLQMAWHRYTQHLDLLYLPITVPADGLAPTGARPSAGTKLTAKLHIESILPKGPYLPCISMAGRALLAGYHRYVFWECFWRGAYK